MARERGQQIVVALATIACCAAIVQAYYARGAPYFQRPETVIDHVIDTEHHLRAAILLLREVGSAIPARATVVCGRPVDGALPDETDYFLLAIGLLPRHKVLLPSTAREGTAEYVIAVQGEFNHPQYRLLHQFKNGFLYVRFP